MGKLFGRDFHRDPTVEASLQAVLAYLRPLGFTDGWVRTASIQAPDRVDATTFGAGTFRQKFVTGPATVDLVVEMVATGPPATTLAQAQTCTFDCTVSLTDPPRVLGARKVAELFPPEASGPVSAAADALGRAWPRQETDRRLAWLLGGTPERVDVPPPPPPGTVPRPRGYRRITLRPR